MASTLDGITVLDLSTGAPAALATMFLSDHGARVVRIVAPNNQTMRDGGFIVWDRGKELLKLDLNDAAKNRDNADLFCRLVKGADVLIDDFAPSSPCQALVDAAWLRSLNPRLVSCSITAFGKRGPLKDEPPIDDLVLARMGVLGGMPGFRPAPVHVVHPLPTVGSALLACLGIASSLLARETTGRGRAVETTMMAGALLYHPKVLGEHIPQNTRFKHTLPAARPSIASIVAATASTFSSAAFTSVSWPLPPGSWASASSSRKSDSIKAAAARKTRRWNFAASSPISSQRGSQAEWAADFEAADVPFAPARLTEEGMTDEQIIHNEMVVTLKDPAVGPVDQMGVPIQLSEMPGRVKGPRIDIADAYDDLPPDYEPHTGGVPSGDGPDPLPLTGIRVLEITNLIAGPTGGRLLGDLGADVIKLEPLTGDLSRPIGRTYFYNINFNKRSISIDTSTGAGKDIVQRVAATADALLANLRPHATERMGIGSAINPTLIEAHLTGYGWTGPYSKTARNRSVGASPDGDGTGARRAGESTRLPCTIGADRLHQWGHGGARHHPCSLPRTRTGAVQRVDGNLQTALCCSVRPGSRVMPASWSGRWPIKSNMASTPFTAFTD